MSKIISLEEREKRIQEEEMKAIEDLEHHPKMRQKLIYAQDLADSIIESCEGIDEISERINNSITETSKYLKSADERIKSMMARNAVMVESL